MKRLLFVLGALIIAVAIGMSLHRYPGVMVLVLGPWRIDIPLWVAVMFFIVLYFVLHFLFRVLSMIIGAAKGLAHFGRHYRKHRAKALSRKGLMALSRGDYVMAEKTLAQSAQDSEWPWYLYLCAGKAALALGDEKKATLYFGSTERLAPDAVLAVALAQASSLRQQGHYHRVIALLSPLLNQYPEHPVLLRNLQESYVATKEWELLIAILPALKKNKILSNEALDRLEQTAWENRLQATPITEIVALQSVWKNMPSKCHVIPAITLYYVKGLMVHKDSTEAETILRQAIKKHWDEELVRCYGMLQHPYPSKLVSQAEGWLSSHPQSSTLLLTLGRLCEQQELWGKAQRYYEASLSLEPNPEAYAQLALLLERLQKPEVGAQYFKKGLLRIATVIEPMPHLSLENE